MLYDPKWEQKTETKADPFSLESLIAWLETMPLSETYDWRNCRGECLIGQFMAFNGMPWRGNYGKISWRKVARGVSMYQIAAAQPWTFGAALERARKLAMG